MISYGKQTIDEDDVKIVSTALKSKLLTGGEYVKKFEKELSIKFGSKYCISVANGTAALHLVAKALKWSKNDIIITTPITFLATPNSVLYVGATLDFVDIDSQTNNIDVDKLEYKILDLIKKNKKISAVIAVDYAGHPCEWKKLSKLSKQYKFKLINDNCHALGASYLNNSKYASKYADIVTQSFHPTKNITTGEGGAILTNSTNIFRKISILRNHGMITNAKIKKKLGHWIYQMNELGYNYRLSDIHSALGINQLRKLDKFIKKRNLIASIYDQAFKNHNNFQIPIKLDNIQHAYHLYPLKINFKSLKVKKLFFNYMLKNSINLQVHYIPIFLQPYYKKKFNFNKNEFPEAITFYKKEVSLPIYPSLDIKDQKFVIKKIFDFFSK